MSLIEDRNNNRVANVKTLAARLAKLGEGETVREFLDALALASGSMLKAAYPVSRGRDVAVSNYLAALQRSLEK
jgi:hypothetical protein